MMKQTLPRSTPVAEGLNPNAVGELLCQLGAPDMGVHSMMLLRHGKVVAENWWAPFRPELPHILFSVTKSFTSTAIGFATQEGLLSPEDSVVSFFPQLLPCRPCGNMEKAKLWHLMTHTTGFADDPRGFSLHTGRTAHFLQSYAKYEPGTHYAYTDDGPNALSAVLQTRTGCTMEEYLRSRLFEPLGFSDWRWEHDGDGITVGGTGLSIVTEDLAKFGQFYLQRGVWNGKRLLNAEWIDRASSQVVPTPGEGGDWAQGYGYLFWRCTPDGVYRADGAFGQLCVVLPKQDMVLAVTGGNNNTGKILNLLWDTLLTEKVDTLVGLNEEMSEWTQTLPVPVGEASSSVAARCSGREYELSPNPMGLSHICFQFGEETKVSFRAGEHSCTCPVGFGKWLDGRTWVLPGEEHARSPMNSMTACAGAWDGNVYRLSVWYPETSYCDQVEITFEENGLVALFQRNVSFDPPSVSKVFGRPSDICK